MRKSKIIITRHCTAHHLVCQVQDYDAGVEDGPEYSKHHHVYGTHCENLKLKCEAKDAMALKFSLTPMGVLAPGSAYARPYARSPIDMSEQRGCL